MQKTILLIIFILVANYSLITTKAACICDKESIKNKTSATLSYKSYDLIFTGIVAQIIYATPEDYIAKIKIDTIIKNTSPPQTKENIQYILSTTSKEECGILLEEGREYLIYSTKKSNNVYQISQCSRTNLLHILKDDIKELDNIPKEQDKTNTILSLKNKIFTNKTNINENN